jgi:hypothetical protein
MVFEQRKAAALARKKPGEKIYVNNADVVAQKEQEIKQIIDAMNLNNQQQLAKKAE